MDDLELLPAAEEVFHLLRIRQLHLVLAESCTAGLVAATLGQIPGISECFCGSAVTYRNLTKSNWLGIPVGDLTDSGPVSAKVTEAMSRAVLERTAEADLSLAITGHLGPDAPLGLDGLVFTAVAHRDAAGPESAAQVRQHRLQTQSRATRQREAVRLVLEELIRVLSPAREGS